MKNCFLSSRVCSILAALLVLDCGIGVANTVSAQVTFDLLVVDLPDASAFTLVPELRDPRRAAKAVQRVMKMIAEKKATLVGWPIITTKSGIRAMAEQLGEFRFAAQYDAPGHATITEVYPDSAGTPGAPIVPVDPKDSPLESPKPAKITTTDGTQGGIPTTFDTRNLGVTLEIEAVLGPDPAFIETNLALQHIRFLGMKKIEIEQKGSGKKTIVEQPQFATNKVTTSLTIKDGDYSLLGVFKLPESPGQIELFILHSEVERRLFSASRGDASENGAEEKQRSDVSTEDPK